MKYPMKLMISGSSIAELAENARKFLSEIGEQTIPNSQGQVVDPNQMQLPIPPPTIPQPAAPIAPMGGIPMGSGDYDSRGIRWDGRIHSESKAKVKDGSWRTRRGVEPAFVNQCESEQRTAAQPIATATPTFQAPLPIAPPIAAPPAPFQPVIVQPVIASPAYPPPGFAPAPVLAQPIPPPVAPAPPPQQPVGYTHSPATFRANLALVLARMVDEGKLDKTYIEALKQHFKVAEIWEVNEAQSNEMFETFAQSGYITRAP